MGQQQSIQENSVYVYNDSHNVGYIESMMNTLIFQPPDKELFCDEQQKPSWLKYMFLPNLNRLSYFVIDPYSNSNSTNYGSKARLDKKYILWSHGNAGDLLSLYSVMSDFHREMNGQIGIIGYDYEGYGYSDGVCSEKNCYNDLTCMINHALFTLNIQQKNLFLVGQSLGTGVVVDFCFRHYWITPIILISSYKSISRVKIDPFSLDIISNVLVDCMDMFTTHYKLEHLKCAIVMYHGTNDNMIPVDHSIEMYNNHPNKIKLILIKDATHNDILNYIGPIRLLKLIDKLAKNVY